MDRFPVSDDVTYTVSEEEMMPQSAVGLSTDMRLPKDGTRYIQKHIHVYSESYVYLVYTHKHTLRKDTMLPEDGTR
jgi:hypothetical protein